MNKAPVHTFRLNRKRGFTLIEILVASAVMVILVGIVIQIISASLNVWNRSSGRLAANQEARIAMDRLTQDLETAVFRNNGLQWFVIENEAPANAPPGTPPNTVSIRLFSPAVDRPRGEPGDICGISYQLKYVNPVSGAAAVAGRDSQFVLYRRIISPSDTFENLMGADNQEALDGAQWNTEPDDYLAGNIVQFRVDLFTEGERESLSGPDFLSSTAASVIYGGAGANVGPEAGDAVARRPLSHAVITLKVLSSEGANIVTGLQRASASGITAGQLEDVIRQHATTYTRKVSFMNRPL